MINLVYRNRDSIATTDSNDNYIFTSVDKL